MQRDCRTALLKNDEVAETEKTQKYLLQAECSKRLSTKSCKRLAKS